MGSMPKTPAPTQNSTDGTPVHNDYLVLVFDRGRPTAISKALCLNRLNTLEIARGADLSLKVWQDPQRNGGRLAVENRTLSSPHCRLWKQNGGWWITDLNSTNGTYCNGQRITEKLLHDGDVVEWCYHRPIREPVPPPPPGAGSLVDLVPLRFFNRSGSYGSSILRVSS